MSVAESITPAKKRRVRHLKAPTGSGLAPDQGLMAGGLDWSWAFVVFRPPSGYPDYLLGTDGSVWSRQRCGRTQTRTGGWRQVFPAPNVKYGHLTFAFRCNGQGKRLSIHRLVLQTFLGPCPPGMECCHNDGRSGNNRIDNLRWDTSKANAADRNRHDRQQRGERHYKAKLTAEDVSAIRRLIARGIFHKEIAPLFGIAVSTVGQIGRNERWRA